MISFPHDILVYLSSHVSEFNVHQSSSIYHGYLFSLKTTVIIYNHSINIGFNDVGSSSSWGEDPHVMSIVFQAGWDHHTLNFRSCLVLGKTPPNFSPIYIYTYKCQLYFVTKNPKRLKKQNHWHQRIPGKNAEFPQLLSATRGHEIFLQASKLDTGSASDEKTVGTLELGPWI